MYPATDMPVGGMKKTVTRIRQLLKLEASEQTAHRWGKSSRGYCSIAQTQYSKPRYPIKSLENEATTASATLMKTEKYSQLKIYNILISRIFK